MREAEVFTVALLYVRVDGMSCTNRRLSSSLLNKLLPLQQPVNEKQMIRVCSESGEGLY